MRLGRLDPERHAIIIPESSLSPWRSDQAFRDAAAKIEGSTLVDEMRLYELWHLAAELATVPGEILEVGVWRGGSGCLIASQSAGSGSAATEYLCDILISTFPDESGGAVEARRFKLVHLDVDVYEGTKDAATWVWPRLVEVGSSWWTTTAVTAWTACNMPWTSSPISRRVA